MMHHPNLSTPAGRRAMLRAAVSSVAQGLRIARTLGYGFLVAEYSERIRSMRERHSSHFRKEVA